MLAAINKAVPGDHDWRILSATGWLVRPVWNETSLPPPRLGRREAQDVERDSISSNRQRLGDMRQRFDGPNPPQLKGRHCWKLEKLPLATVFKCKRCGLTIPATLGGKTIEEDVDRFAAEGAMTDCDERYVFAVMDL